MKYLCSCRKESCYLKADMKKFSMMKFKLKAQVCVILFLFTYMCVCMLPEKPASALPNHYDWEFYF